DLREALVAAVAAQAADRLAAPGHGDEQAECGHDRQPDEPAPQLPAEPHRPPEPGRQQYEAAEDKARRRNEPLRARRGLAANSGHRTSPLPGRRNTWRGPWRAGAMA